jgi:hypothetical protein
MALPFQLQAGPESEQHLVVSPLCDFLHGGVRGLETRKAPIPGKQLMQARGLVELTVS